MITVKKIKPMFTALVTTMNKYEDYQKTNGGIIDASKQIGAVKDYQTVLAIGSNVRDIKVGDLVYINPQRFAVMKHKDTSLQNGIIGDNKVVEYKFDIVKLAGVDCLLLQDRDIEFIIEEYEEVPDEAPSQIIQPPKPSIIS